MLKGSRESCSEVLQSLFNDKLRASCYPNELKWQVQQYLGKMTLKKRQFMCLQVGYQSLRSF